MNIPNLRFPDFSDDWQVSKLGDVTSKIGSGSTPRGGEEVYTSDGILFIRSQNVKRNILDLTDSTFIPEEVHFQMSGSEVKSNDVLLNITGASIGRSCVVPSSVITGNVNQHVCIVRTGRHLEPNFLQPFLASRRGQKLIYQGQTGSGREGLNFQSIRSFKLSLPTKPEQQKIAAFLAAVDSKIEQLSKKQELLGEYKKGLMQQIFSQAIRFKADDGIEFPDWEEKKLGGVGRIRKGSQLNKSELTDTGDYPAINGGINPSGYTDKWNTGKNTITISEGGNSCGYINFITSKFWSGGHCYSIEELKGDVLNRFLFQYLKFNEHLIMRLRVGSGLPNIQKGEINNFKVNLPSLEEQTKIANLLSSIDSKIEQVGKQLRESKQFKKALLQQMFV